MFPVNPFRPQSPNLPAHGAFVCSYQQIREVWNAAPTSNELSLRHFIRYPHEPVPLDLDRLVALISEAQRDPSPFGGWVFEQAARIMLETEPTESYIANNEFSHALKYLFTGACFKPALRTIVDSSSTIPLATALLDLACVFCERSQSLGTTPLVVRAVMLVNMANWLEHRAVTDFFLKPKCFTSPAFLDLLRAQTAHEERDSLPSESGRVSAPFRMNQMFCEASSPSQFLLWVFESNVVVPRGESLTDLRRLLVGHLGNDVDRYPFLTRDGGVPEKRPAAFVQREFAPGCYFDVFGTLINHDGTPNVRLIQRMLDLWKSTTKCPVYIVSDSQSDEVKRALDFLSEMPPLLPKEALYGKELECLIDNCGPEGQGLHAKRHLLPEAVVASGVFRD